MSGAEALAVIGIIANILSLIDTCVDVYERAEGFNRNINEIPKAFRSTSNALPLVKSALLQTEKRMNEGETDEETCQALRKVLDSCSATVTKLNDTLLDILPSKDASRWSRGWKAVSSVGQDKKVQALDKDLMRFVEVLTLYHSSQGPSAAEISQLWRKSEIKIAGSASKPLFMVRYQKDDSFIGREEIMLEITKRFEQKASRVAIAGIGGVGKSRIAIEYCYQYRDQKPNSNIFWVHGGSRSRLAAAYREIAQRIKILDPDRAAVNILTLVSDWLSEEENGAWLMILDNVDDSDLWITSEGPLINYLPRGKHGSMLITTRNSQLGKTISKSRKKPIDVPIFGSDDSVTLLRSKVSEDDEITDEDSKEISQVLGFLPLAITQAAAYLDQNEISVAEYLALLKSSKADAVDLLVRKSHDDSRDPDIQNSVFHTWKISFDQILREHPRAAKILSLMAYLDRQAIQVDLLHDKSEGELEIREAMQKLKAFSLVTEESKDKIFSMHRIVQLSIKWYHDSHGIVEAWQEAALARVLSNIPLNTDIKAVETLKPHIQLVTSYNYSAEVCKRQYATLLTLLGDYHFSLAQYQLATSQYLEALKLRESILNPGESGDRDIINLMIGLASSLTWEGGQDNHDRAEKLVRQALALSEKDFLEGHYAGLGTLARLLASQGKFSESEKLYEQIMKIPAEKYGSGSLAMCNIIVDLAVCFDAQERYDKAESLWRNAIGIRKAHGVKDFGYAVMMIYLASNLENQRKHRESLALYRENWSLLVDLLGPSHQMTLEARKSLVRSLLKNSEFKEAEEVTRETLQMRADSEDTLNCIFRDWLGWSLRGLKRADEAEVEYRENLRLRIAIYGLEDDSTLYTRDSLALLLAETGRFEEAEELFNENAAMWSKKFGPNHFGTVAAQRNLTDSTARRLSKSGNFDEALELYKKKLREELTLEKGMPIAILRSVRDLAFQVQRCGRSEQPESMYRELLLICTEVAGTTHLATIRTMAFLATHLLQQHRLEEAEGIYRTVVELETQLLKDDRGHAQPNSQKPDLEETLMDMDNYAFVQVRNGKHADAETTLLEIIALSIKLRGPEYTIRGPEYAGQLRAMHQLGKLLWNLKRFGEAESLLQEVLEIRTRMLGPSHEDTLQIMTHKAGLFIDLKRYSEAEMLYREVLKTRTQALGPDHEDTLSMMSRVGLVLSYQDKFVEAELLLQDALRISIQVLGTEHMNTPHIMWNLGNTSLRQERFDEAEKLFRDVLALEVQSVGADHKVPLSTMMTLGGKLIIMRKFNAAEIVLRDALARCTKALDINHATTLQVMCNLGEALLHLGQVDEAKDLLNQAFTLHVQVFGLEDERTVKVKNLQQNGLSKSSTETVLVVEETADIGEEETIEI